MSGETSSKPPSHHMSKRTRAPPPPTKKPSFEEGKNGVLSDQEKDTLKKNGSIEDIGSAIPGPDERQFTVILPGDKAIKASAIKDTPVLDLLIKISAKNHLNPTAHMIAQPAARTKDPPVQLKPNQKLSDVVGDTIYIIPRSQKQLFVYQKDFKKSAVYEPTTRITVISSKNRKICLRVDPEKTLEELLPKICEERGVEPANQALRLVDQPNQPLDMSQTLEKTGVVEFLLMDLKAPPAGGFEFETVTEQKKKKGSFFGRMTKKKKGYELGGMGTIEDVPKTAPAERQGLTRQNTAPPLSPPPKSSAPTQEPEESNTNSLKKRRPAPPPPMGKRLTSGSDEEKTDEDSNTLKKRRAPAPPRPNSPPHRSKSLGASSAHTVPTFPPPRPSSPPMRSSSVLYGEKEAGDAQLVTSPSQEGMVEELQNEPPPEPTQDASGLEGEVVTLSLTAAVEREEQEAVFERPEGEENNGEGPEEETDAVAMPTEEPDQDKDSKAQRELLSHMMKMSLDEDAKDTYKYPPHTQADDAHDMLEEKSVHALAFEVTREATPVPPVSPKEAAEKEHLIEKAIENPAIDVEEEESPKKVEATTLETPKEEEAKTEESPKKEEAEAKGSPSSGGGDRAAEQLSQQYAALQAQLAALQQQMHSPQKPGLMEMQMQQLQQQMLLQQQLINQMVMASSQQPVVLPLPYQQSMLSPQQQMLSPQQQILSPQQQMLSPQQQMLSPQQQMLSPQQQILSPQQQLISPQQQMVMPPQQLMMTPPMMYPAVSISPNTSLSDAYAQQATATATVQAQQTPIPSTLDMSESVESPVKESDISKSDVDSSQTEEEVETKRSLSPALKADEVSVSHPTYHFVRSREVPNKDSKVVHASPPNTLRSPKQHQRASILDESLVVQDSPEPAQKEANISDTNENPSDGGSNAEKLSEPEPSQEEGGMEVTVDANQNQTIEKEQTDSPKEKTTATETTDKNGMAGESSSISAFAVSDSSTAGPEASSEAKSPKSPKQKKSGFSLFRKKAPKYSYILSAQREFSRKSETERQQKSPTNAANDAKTTDSDKTGRDLWPR